MVLLGARASLEGKVLELFFVPLHVRESPSTFDIPGTMVGSHVDTSEPLSVSSLKVCRMRLIGSWGQQH